MSYARNEGGSQKVTNDDGGEEVTISPKNDDVIYEQPLNVLALHVFVIYRATSEARHTFFESTHCLSFRDLVTIAKSLSSGFFNMADLLTVQHCGECNRS